MGQLLTILNAATFAPGLPLWAFGRALTLRTEVASDAGGLGTAEAARDAAATHFNGGPGFDAGLRARILLRLEVTGEPYFDAELPERPTPALTPSFGT